MKNQVILSGNVGQKPELKESKNQKKYLSFSIAVNEDYKPKDSDEYVKKTVWFNLVVYDKRAETLAKILDKGSSVVVTGKLTMRDSKEQEGDKSYKTLEIQVLNVEVMGKRAPSEKSSDQE
jgi:single-strand DNA-binding protein